MLNDDGAEDAAKQITPPLVDQLAQARDGTAMLARLDAALYPSATTDVPEPGWDKLLTAAQRKRLQARQSVYHPLLPSELRDMGARPRLMDALDRCIRLPDPDHVRACLVLPRSLQHPDGPGRRRVCCGQPDGPGVLLRPAARLCV